MALLPAAMLAQPPSNPNPPTVAQIVTERVARLTTLLTLTTAQQTSATNIFTTEETALAALRTAEQTAHTAMTTAIEKNDANGITLAATQLGKIATDEAHATGTAEAAFYALLTADQQTKYKTLIEAGAGGGPGPRPGPGGPGRQH